MALNRNRDCICIHIQNGKPAISEYPVPHKKDDSKIKYLIDIQKILNGTKRSY